MSKNEISKVFKDVELAVNDAIVAMNAESKVVKMLGMAGALTKLRALLTADTIKDIMVLQNTKLGFKTDNTNGYPSAIVRDCVIDAMINDLDIVGNQFNIIKSQMYITKEGFESKLKKINSLKYKIKDDNISFDDEKGISIVKMLVEWDNNGEKGKETLEFRMNLKWWSSKSCWIKEFDAERGKGERKARCWLFNHLTGSNLWDGDVDDSKTQTEIVKDEDVSILEDEDVKEEKNFTEIIMSTPYEPERILKYLKHIGAIDSKTTLDQLINDKICKKVREKIVNDDKYFKSIINKMLNLEEAAKNGE